MYQPLTDIYGRTLDYLRLSITDRCNLRCTYCMPEEGVDFISRDEILSYEDMDKIIYTLKQMGLRKLRFTGGEPFVRRDFDIFLESLLKAEPDYSLHITTNATVFPHKIDDRNLSKLASVNISLDSLDKNVFNKITRRDMLEKVWNNIHRYHLLGIPVKINMVVQPELNFEEIPAFVELTRQMDIEVRFIEPMPFNGSGDDSWDYVSADAIYKLIQSQFDVGKMCAGQNDTAIKYRVKNYLGNIGIIPAYTRSMCDTCNRLRINAQGILRTCLYSQDGINIKELLKTNTSEAELIQFISDTVKAKPKDGFEAEKNNSHFLSMTKLGG